MRPLILISNDDGYEAKGIRCLVEMVRPLGDILVCAPDGPRSGFSCAFSATTPLLLTLRERSEGVEVWSCNGTPVDCVKMALSQIAHRRPAMVIGGINHGDNASTNLHYSGTVGVAIEGAMKRIPSVAFSLCDYDDEADFVPMTSLVLDTVDDILQDGLPLYTCLNVNVPKEWNGEVRYCRMAFGHWRNEVDERKHPGNGKPYYWMTGYYQNDEPEAKDTDAYAIAHGYAAITPLTADSTDYQFLKRMQKNS